MAEKKIDVGNSKCQGDDDHVLMSKPWGKNRAAQKENAVEQAGDQGLPTSDGFLEFIDARDDERRHEPELEKVRPIQPFKVGDKGHMTEKEGDRQQRAEGYAARKR